MLTLTANANLLEIGSLPALVLASALVLVLGLITRHRCGTAT